MQLFIKTSIAEFAGSISTDGITFFERLLVLKDWECYLKYWIISSVLSSYSRR